MRNESGHPRRRIVTIKPYANNLKPCIRRYGYKVQEVADGIGMSRGTLSDYVVGNRPAPRDCLRKIADFLGCEIEEFHYLSTSNPLHTRPTPPPISDTPEPKPGQESRPLPGIQRAADTQPLSLLLGQSMPLESTPGDCASRFGIKLAQIITLITQWNGPEACHQQLQASINQEIAMFDAIKPQLINEEYTLSRRQALIAIAALPTALLVAVYQRQDSALVIREFFSRCAASIIACRHLINGQELSAVEQVLPQYLPTLKTLAQNPSSHQPAAARLAVQADQLGAILALHRNNLSAMEYYGREAVKYSLLSGDRNLYIAMLRQVAAALRYQKRSREVVEIYQEVLPSMQETHPLLRAMVYAGLAWAYGHSKQEQESLRYLDLAHEAFASKSEAAQSLLDIGRDNVYMYAGYTYLALHEQYPGQRYAVKAWEAFTQISSPSSTPAVPERIRLEAINHLALAALAIDDQEQFCHHLEQGITGASALGSQKRRQEAIDAYWKGRHHWPHEPQVRELADLFVN